MEPKVLLRRFVSIAGLLISSLYAAIFLMIPVIIIEPFFKKLAFTLHYKIASIWFRLVLFVFEVVNNIEIRFYGDDIPEGESMIMMMNHPSEVDWLFSFSVAYRKKALSKIKVILKNEVRLVPGVGWGCDNLDYIYLSRDWNFDEKHMEYKLNKYIENDFKPWLVIFPEGTDIDEEKLKKSHAFAEKNGYPKFNNVLLPRHKGLHACVEPLRNTIDSVYDVTIGYESKPTILSCVSGSNPKVVNMHFKRYSLNEVPSNEDDLQKWLFKIYAEKDKMLQDLKENGQYSMPYTKTKFEPSFLLTALAWFYYLIIPATHLLIRSNFVKLYFVASIIYYILNSKVEILRKLRGLQNSVYIPKPKQH
ncbi:hypothetical protein DICPUDRAFT_27831 [Dictyostelium purpureum]|uniref:Phospholipid/glycerol acyltransferase domain-containing protein n=1 Tax=Dictyostelium purpureum TaxID=5786 RepID=F0ZAQ2_DICPU|nr:uncharacterized protein DICPUDRAFT_27831 [Dictyostelium purpureum]EGC38927.1 hypothetical protein DICPUDRAFT_27831 [Dictyostelium purpureum]|eukprot:XP_003284492.1 hypothetical protein DICPUDRAFT_27831 [Dictyostelium purpureum]